MSPCKIRTGILSLVTVGALAAPAAADDVADSIRAAAAEPPLPVYQTAGGEMALNDCSRYPDDVLVTLPTGLRNCEAAEMAARGDESIWLGGPRAHAGADQQSNMFFDACWRHPDDVLVNPASGRRNCAE